MDIELQLREMFVLRDPGRSFTDKVLSRVGDVPQGSSPEGVVRLADVRASKRGRRMLLGVLVVVGAAAAVLPFMTERGPEATVVQEGGGLAEPGAGPPAAEPALPMSVVQSDPAGDAEEPQDCVDPDVLRSLLLPGSSSETFRIVEDVPPELAEFKAPRQLTWLGASERGTGQTMSTSAVYRSELVPEAARVAAVGALTAGGWELHSDNRLSNMNLFVAANSSAGSETYCRDGRQLTLASNALDGVTYVVLSASRVDAAAGYGLACNQPVRPMRPASSLDAYMPSLELPHDPATGQPVARIGGGGGGGMKPRAHVSFRLKDSVDGVAHHFAGQLAGQGWSADTSWGGNGTAGSSWTRRLDADTVLQATLLVTAFEDDRFTAMFRATTMK